MYKKKVVLVSAGLHKGEYSQFARFLPMTAIGIHYIKAILERERYYVSIVNQTNDGLTNGSVAERIDQLNPDYVLFNQFFSTRGRIRKIVKQLNGDYIIGVGGHDATFNSISLSEDELNQAYSDFDFIWRGEAETKLTSELSSINSKQEKPKLIDNIKGRVQNLDSLPILQHDDYSGDVGFLVSSRGCYCNGCDFCTTPSFYRDGWKARSVENVAKELENLVKAGKKYVFICDDNFLGFSEEDIERGNEIIEKCKELDLKVMIMTSKEQILRAEEKGHLANWRDTVFRAFIGIENGDESAIRKLGKRCNISQHAGKSKAAINALYDNGIALFAGYINFNPESTFKELENSERFIYENGMEAANFTNLCQGLRLYEGTKILEKHKTKGINNIRIVEGEYRYDFNDSKVSDFFNYLSSVRGEETDTLDNLNYETIDLIYINQLQETELGEQNWQLRSRINDNNHKFFRNCLKDFRDGNRDRLEERKKEFLNKTKRFIEKYIRLHSEIVSAARYK